MTDAKTANQRSTRDWPRKPVRSNGVERYSSLLDAFERLLLRYEPDQLSISDIATEAGASPASVYHFFPTITAAHVGLTERIADRFADSVQDVGVGHFTSWPALLLDWTDRARAYYNSQPVAPKLMYGPSRSWSARRAELLLNRRFARGMLDRLVRDFEIDETPHLQQVFEIGLTLHDSIWSMSIVEHGTITDEMSREAQRALIAYLRGHLPEHAARRASPEPGVLQ